MELIISLSLTALYHARSKLSPFLSITLYGMLSPPLSVSKLSLSLSHGQILCVNNKTFLISNFVLSDILSLLISHRGSLSLFPTQVIPSFYM